MTKKVRKTTYYVDLYSAIFWPNKCIVCCPVQNAVDTLKLPFPDGERDRPAQWYITEYSDQDVKFMKEYFPDLDIRYCEKLGLYMLGVHEWGTLWRDCRTPCKIEWIAESKDWDSFGHMAYKVNVDLAGNILHKTIHFYLSEEVYHEEG